jgi:hypothetical protein
LNIPAPNGDHDHDLKLWQDIQAMTLLNIPVAWWSAFGTMFGSFLLASTVHSAGVVTDNIRITSHLLGYDLQYRVYQPEGSPAGGPYPVLFLTDGQNYLGRGHMDQVLDREIGKGNIQPVIAVFVDPRDPDDP